MNKEEIILKEDSVALVKNHKTSWFNSIVTFLSPILIIMSIRWFIIEPYMIPSGSMIPTLLVHDHIFVSKWVYGLRWPFTESWIMNWNKPKLGEIVVFRYPKEKEIFFVKRVVALEGDTIEIQEGQLIRNGLPVERKLLDGEYYNKNILGRDKDISSKERKNFDLEDEAGVFQYYSEQLGDHHFISRSFNEDRKVDGKKIVVPTGHFFVVGDNRDESSDSRVWGFVPIKNLIGRASMIWLSCDETLESATFICDPKTIRWSRLISFIH